jgi:hypothetical protein
MVLADLLRVSPAAASRFKASFVLGKERRGKLNSLYID